MGGCVSGWVDRIVLLGNLTECDPFVEVGQGLKKLVVIINSYLLPQCSKRSCFRVKLKNLGCNCLLTSSQPLPLLLAAR